jgi:FkbM family methyltransferase
LATHRIRRRAGKDACVSFVDGLWTRRVGQAYLPDGTKFEYLYSNIEGWRDEFKQYERDTQDYWLRYYSPREGDTIIDVGAGRGEDTLTFSAGVGRTGRVISIEAHPLSFAILKSFCRLNRLTNVDPIQVALMDEAGTVFIAESETSWMENAVTSNGGPSAVRVQARPLDDICREAKIDRISFLKMNIEGGERFALPGMRSVISRVDQICVACHDFRANAGHGEEFRTRAFVKDFLTESGFKLASRPDDPRASVPDHIFGLR